MAGNLNTEGRRAGRGPAVALVCDDGIPGKAPRQNVFIVSASKPTDGIPRAEASNNPFCYSV